MSLQWVAQQIQAASSLGHVDSPQLVAFNPRPPGIPIKGSATSLVLEFLMKNPARWFTHQQIVEAVGCSRVSVDWALIRLRNWKIVEIVPDEARNSRYLRYRISKKKVED